MSTKLYVKNPNNVQKSIDVDKIFTTDGGTMTGDIYFTTINNKTLRFEVQSKNPDEASTYYRRGMNIGWDYNNKDGSGFFVRANDWPGTEAGAFGAYACDGTNIAKFQGRPNGSLTWKGWEILQVGIIQAFAGSNTPPGWLLCDGAAISRTTYSRLFSIIATKYGAGDGSTTFNVPNLTDKFIQGSGTVGTVKAAGLPNIEGTFATGTSGYYVPIRDGASGAFSRAGYGTFNTANSNGGSTTGYSYAEFHASSSNSIYGNSTTVQPRL